MSLRSTINENPIIPVAGVLIALAVCGYFLWGIIMAPKAGTIGGDFVAFYTIDDGKTVFADKHPPSEPFQQDGKDAVLARMYTCDGDKTRFCAYLIKRAMEPTKKNAAAGLPPQMINYIKKPGDTEWIPETSWGKWSQIERSVKCPQGSGEPVGVTPAGISTESTAKRPSKQ